MSGYIADYCPSCGQRTIQKEHSGRLRPVCSACGHVVYFDPKVAAIAFITQNDRVLLVQRNNEPGFGKWALPGGYVDYDESPEVAAKRETFEETGLEVNIGPVINVYHKVEDGGVITIAYEAHIIGGQEQAGDDAQRIAWFTRDSLPELVFYSTYNLIERWSSNFD